MNERNTLFFAGDDVRSLTSKNRVRDSLHRLLQLKFNLWLNHSNSLVLRR